MSYKNIQVSVEDTLALITLNRPEQLNPLDALSVHELIQAVEHIERLPGVRTVAITGAGRAFSAGGDLKGYLELFTKPDRFREFLLDFHHLLGAMESSDKVYIGAVNGVCVAGGLELLLACDLALAAESAKIGDGHLNFGQLPGAGGSQRLARAVGALRAKHLLMTGELLPAREAERIGLVGEVVADERLLERVRELAARAAGMSSVGLRGAKYLVNKGLQTDREAGLQLEMTYVFNYATAEPDAMEGLKAFKDKRKPKYRTV